MFYVPLTILAFVRADRLGFFDPARLMKSPAISQRPIPRTVLSGSTRCSIAFGLTARRFSRLLGLSMALITPASPPRRCESRRRSGRRVRRRVGRSAGRSRPAAMIIRRVKPDLPGYRNHGFSMLIKSAMIEIRIPRAATTIDQRAHLADSLAETADVTAA